MVVYFFLYFQINPITISLKNKYNFYFFNKNNKTFILQNPNWHKLQKINNNVEAWLFYLNLIIKKVLGGLF